MLTEKGQKLLVGIKEIMEARDDGQGVSMEDIAEHLDITVHSVRGTVGKVAKEGFITSEAVEVEDGKKRKRYSLTDDGWAFDVDAYRSEMAAAAEAEV